MDCEVEDTPSLRLVKVVLPMRCMVDVVPSLNWPWRKLPICWLLKELPVAELLQKTWLPMAWQVV
jgi:hypothetical protein